MDLEMTEFRGSSVCPVLDYNDNGLAVIRLYENSDADAIIAEAVEYEVVDIIESPSEMVMMAHRNQDLIQDRDLLTLKPPLATGILWMIDPEDELKVIDIQNAELVCSVEPSKKAEANAKILAAARHLLNAVQGVYYRLKFDEGMLPTKDNEPLCRVLVSALREAGVGNVDDIECYDTAIDDEGEEQEA